MIVTPWERREAERFDELLNDSHPSAHNDMSPLLTLTRQLEHAGDALSPSLDPGVRKRQRARLLAVATVQGVGATARPPKQRAPRRLVPQMRRRLALLAGTLAVLIALSGVGVASNDAVPGDALYSIKRTRENAQLALAYSDVTRGRLHLDFARNRLHEAKEVAKPEHRARALDEMDAETRSAMRELGSAAVDRGNPEPLKLVDDFVREQQTDLNELTDKLPASARQRTHNSVRLLADVTDRSSGLRTTLECSRLLGTSQADELGPVPQNCAAAPSTPSVGEGSTSDETPTTTANTQNAPSSPSADTSPESETENPNTQETPTPQEEDGVLDTVGGILGGLLGSLLG